MNRTCEHCEYFKDNSCRRRAPVFIGLEPRQNTALFRWPRVSKEQWCGEFNALQNPSPEQDILELRAQLKATMDLLVEGGQYDKPNRALADENAGLRAQLNSAHEELDRLRQENTRALSGWQEANKKLDKLTSCPGDWV